MHTGSDVAMTRMQLRTLLRDQRGFSLTELLATLIIVTLATIMVATGLPAAIDAYHNMVDVSNAQALLSTTTTILRNELAMSEDWEVTDNTVTYTSDETFEELRISLAQADDDYYASELVREKKKADGTAWDSTTKVPVALGGMSVGNASREGATTKGTRELYVTCSGISQVAGKNVVKFENVKVLKGSTELATATSYEVRMLEPKE